MNLFFCSILSIVSCYSYSLIWGDPEGLGEATSGSSPGGRAWGGAGYNEPRKSFFLFGGTCQGSYRRDIWEFNFENTNWNSLTPPDTSGNEPGSYSGTFYIGARSHFAYTTTDTQDEFLVFGGEGYASTASRSKLNDIWAFDFNTLEWTLLNGDDLSSGELSPSYGTPRTYGAGTHPGCALDATMVKYGTANKYFLFGGMTKDDIYTNAIWLFNRDNDYWQHTGGTAGASGVPGSFQGWSSYGSAHPSRRKGAQLWYSTYLYIFGGYSPHTYINEFWAYDYPSNQWSWRGGAIHSFESGDFGTQGNYGTTSSPFPPSMYGHTAVFNQLTGEASVFFGDYLYPSFWNAVWMFEASSERFKHEHFSKDVNTYGSGVPGGRMLSQVALADHAIEVAPGEMKFLRFVFYGGQGLNSLGSEGYLSDLWGIYEDCLPSQFADPVTKTCVSCAAKFGDLCTTCNAKRCHNTQAHCTAQLDLGGANFSLSFGDYCYTVYQGSLHGDYPHWREGEELCGELHANAHLASIHSAEESEFLKDFIKEVHPGTGNKHYIIGLTAALDRDDSTNPDADWVWTDGTPYDYREWLPGDPDHPTGACSLISITDSLSVEGWDDDYCNTGQYGYICKVLHTIDGAYENKWDNVYWEWTDLHSTMIYGGCNFEVDDCPQRFNYCGGFLYNDTSNVCEGVGECLSGYSNRGENYCQCHVDTGNQDQFKCFDSTCTQDVMGGSDSYYFDNACYTPISTQLSTWTSAEEYCRGLAPNSHLVSVNDIQILNDIVLAHCGNDCESWIGFHALWDSNTIGYPNGDWRWVNGMEFPGGFPLDWDDSSGGSCVKFVVSGGNPVGWKAVACDEQASFFVCKRDDNPVDTLWKNVDFRDSYALCDFESVSCPEHSHFVNCGGFRYDSSQVCNSRHGSCRPATDISQETYCECEYNLFYSGQFCEEIEPSVECSMPSAYLLNGRCYFAITQNSTWNQAEEACKSANSSAHLVSLDSSATSEFLWDLSKALSSSGELSWVGLTVSMDVTYAGNPTEGWVWSDGRSQEINLWVSMNPYISDYCAAFDGSEIGKWGSHPCNDILSGTFVCYYYPSQTVENVWDNVHWEDNHQSNVQSSPYCDFENDDCPDEFKFCSSTGSVDDDCSGNGACRFDVLRDVGEKNYCDCDLGWEDSDCSSSYCIPRDCSGKGLCSGPLTCSCVEGWRLVSNCSMFDCFSKNNCSGHGDCEGPHSCSCESGWGLIQNDCSEFDCISLNNCNSHGSCEGPNECLCTDGWTGLSCSEEVSQEDDDNNDNDDVVDDDNNNDDDDEQEGVNAVGISVGVVSGVVVVVLFVLVLAFVVIVFILLKKRNKRKNDGQGGGELDDLGDGKDYADFRVNADLFKVDYGELKIIETIGKGGQNCFIYLAEYNSMKVAFKCFQLSDFKANKFSEFEKEVQIMASLSHPFILKFYGATVKVPRVGIIMEFCSRGDMRHYLKDDGKDLSFEERVRYTMEIAQGLRFLHDSK